MVYPEELTIRSSINIDYEMGMIEKWSPIRNYRYANYIWPL